MNLRSEDPVVRRLPVSAAVWGLIAAFSILLFTKRLFYSIISLAAAGIAIAGFLLMIYSVNRILTRSRGRFFFFSLALAKLAVIVAAFFAVSRISEGAVLAFVVGISAVPMALLSEGGRLLIRGGRHGA
jgi:hypothetical protein